MNLRGIANSLATGGNEMSPPGEVPLDNNHCATHNTTTALPCPEGAAELSPALQRRVFVQLGEPSRLGRLKLPIPARLSSTTPTCVDPRSTLRFDVWPYKIEYDEKYLWA